MKSNILRHYCQQLNIESDEKREMVWVKQLRHILEKDIHNKELGCKCNTHIKIGDVHLNSFYESRILFSHNVWSNRFAYWLYEKLISIDKKNIIVVGYETDVEPIIFILQNMIAKIGGCLRYGIYEEKKYTQNNGYAQTEENIRYINSILDLMKSQTNVSEYQFVFFCGTSTTLSTFKKMREQLLKEIDEKIDSALTWRPVILDSLFYSLIQVKPVMGKFADDTPYQSIYDENDLSDYKNHKITRRFKDKDNTKIVSEYLVDIQNLWYDADLCPLCFPLKYKQSIFSEKPLIETSETSVVPFMMIKDLICSPTVPKNYETNSLLWNNDYGYEYIYYDHIDRMDHHFKYYVRTAHLIKDIMDDKHEGKRQIFKNRCVEIANALNPKDPKGRVINIIVFPSSFGDEVFPLAINEYVFSNNAYLLAVNPNKEFRSNFETKYSNLAYVLEQTNSKNERPEIRFHYVAKQIISIDTFTRIKSFIRSMMCRHTADHKLPDNVKLFSSVIVFLSRISKSSVSDYIDQDSFFHFIDVAIPSLRNYGDSCPICKRRLEVNSYIEASNLDICISHWSHKYDLYKPKSIENAIDRWDKEKEELRKRKYNRFSCENKIWIKILELDCNDEDSYMRAFIEGMCGSNNYVDAETFISCIKAISGPFLYFKEYAKDSALHLLLHSIESLRTMAPVNTDLDTSVKVRGTSVKVEVSNERTFKILFTSIYQQYTTLVVLLNCLASMDSTYILNPSVIIDLFEFVKKLSEKATITRKDNTSNEDNKESLLTFGKGNCLVLKEPTCTNTVEAFLSCIVYAFKRVICGISGEAKSRYFNHFFNAKDIQLNTKKFLDNPGLSELFYVLYLENSSSCNKQEFKQGDIIEKYRTYLLSYLREKIHDCETKDEITLLLAYKDPSFIHIYPLCGDVDKTDKDTHAKSDCEQEFIKNYESKYKKCFESDLLKYCGWSRNETNTVFVISLKYYSEGQLGSDTNTDDNDEQTMYLVVEFKGSNETGADAENEKIASIIPYLRIIRMLLEDRYYLCKEIYQDIQNNSIRESIQAREAELLMAEGKNVAHNGSKDIHEMLTLIKDELVATSDAKGEAEKGIHYTKACRLISVMMSYCIGRASNDHLLRSYYSRSSNESVFANEILHMEYKNVLIPKDGTDTPIDEEAFLRRYFEDLMSVNEDEASDYLKECLYRSNYSHTNNENIEVTEKKKGIKKQVGKLSISIKGEDHSDPKELLERIIDIFRDINAFPCIFRNNNLTKHTSAGSIFLVGFLDLFLNNITKHAEGSDITIKIDYGRNAYYNIIVENDLSKNTDTSSTGITLRFFELLNRISTNAEQGFNIESEPDSDTNSFVSKIKVYKSKFAQGGKND